MSNKVNNRVTVTLSKEVRDLLAELQGIISKELGGGDKEGIKVTQGFAIGYAIKACMKEKKVNTY